MIRFQVLFSILVTLCVNGLLVGQSTQALPDDVLRLKRVEAPLVDAAKNGQWNRVDDLATEANVDQTAGDHSTALHWAVYHDNQNIAKRLIELGADVSAENIYESRPIVLACRNGSAEILKLLLEGGADPKRKSASAVPSLLVAARTGDADCIDLLVKSGVDVNQTRVRDQTALMWAASAGNLDAVKKLVELGADLKPRTPSGFDAIAFAVREGRTPIVEYLLDQNLDVNQPMDVKKKPKRGPAKGMTLLTLAVENGHFELALTLLKRDADPNHKGPGYSPLHAITGVRKPMRGDGNPGPIGSGSVSSLDLVRALVEHGVEADVRHGKRNVRKGGLNLTDATALLLAAKNGDLPMVKLLHELGADVSASNADGTTPLLAAAGVGVIGSGDETPGTEDEAIETIEWLLEQGADINVVDSKGNTVMHGAALKSWYNLVPILAQRGADPKIWDSQNVLKRTPMEIAIGHRPGNFRPCPDTQAAIQQVLTESE